MNYIINAVLWIALIVLFTVYFRERMSIQAEEEEESDCTYCGGCGGFDASKDPEAYDQWVECASCDGTGKHIEGDIFVPERDALTPND